MKTQILNPGRITKRTSILAGLLIISSAIFAQKSIKDFQMRDYTAQLFKSTEEIVRAMNRTKEEKAFYEEKIQLEDWMVDLEKWAIKMDSTSLNAVDSKKDISGTTESEVFTEEEMELENWMMDSHWIKIEKFSEEELNMENWMSNPEEWMVDAIK